MTRLDEHQSAETTKLLFIGDPGSGKTGALASLAAAGYELYIIDVDNGLDVLSNLLSDPKSPYAKGALERVHFRTITDAMKNLNGKLVPRSATTWQRVIKLLDGQDKWDEPGHEPGPIVNWDSNKVLVIDSLTLLSAAALAFTLSLVGRLGQKPYEGDWYDGQLLVEGLLQMLYDENVKCNVIVISHITYLGSKNDPQIGYPSTLGKALPPKVGRYFNTALQAKTLGFGSQRKRVILTDTMGIVELKNSAPLSVAKEYPLTTGLADFFRDVRKSKPKAPEAPLRATVVQPALEAPKTPAKEEGASTSG